jgi:hypothetical protein
MKKFFSHLYFADPQLDVSEVLTSVEVAVKIGPNTQGGTLTAISWATDVSDMGGDKEQLDATPLISPVKINKSGLEDREAWTIEYFHNDTDFAFLNGYKQSGDKVKIEVDLPDGSKFTNTGVVTGNYMTAIAVNNMLKDKATIDLDAEWAYTNG